MSTKEILEKYIKFYEDRGHKLTPNMSLVPEGDSTLLFTNSGMFPLVPYLSGQPHPLGRRLVNVQRAGRYQEDLENIGDRTHTTAFHMIGNWSLGDYFKTEQLNWVYEFLIEIVGLDPKRLFATVFEGDEYAPKDTVSIEILITVFKKYGIDAKENSRIFASNRKNNWWQRGDAVGELGGPDSEIHYYLGEGSGEGKNPYDNEDVFIEIGNSVFMQYKRTENNGWAELSQKNIDFGGGLERIVMVSQQKKDIFETDFFWPIVERAQELSGKNYYENEDTKKAMRILADHMRGATLLAMDGVIPSNKDQGYMLRRLLRRMVRYGMMLGITKDISVQLVKTTVDLLSWLYPDLPDKQKNIVDVFSKEEFKFRETIERGSKQFERLMKTGISDVSVVAFDLYQSYGYPLELILEDFKERNIKFDEIAVTEKFNEEVQKHQALSRKGAEQKFKGGLADHSENVVKYHTATHLLHQALRQVLGTHVIQMGSNITGERLRFDFPNDKKLTDEQLKEVARVINEKIAQKLPVNFVDLPKDKAEATGAVHAFNEKYGDVVRLYFVGDSLETAFSKEFCGGPHVTNTGEIGEITIYKQESIGKGIQRIYAKNS